MAHIKNISARPIFLTVDGTRVTFNPDATVEIKGGLNAVKKSSKVNAYYVEENMLISVEEPKKDEVKK